MATKKLKGTIHEAHAHILHWYRLGPVDQYGRRKDLRLGQYVWNMMGKKGETFPELFYAEDAQLAESLIYQEFED